MTSPTHRFAAGHRVAAAIALTALLLPPMAAPHAAASNSAPPRQVAAVAGLNSITIIWQAPRGASERDKFRYDVEVRAQKGPWRSADCPAAETSCALTDVRSGLVHQVRVRAVKNQSPSRFALSNTVTPYSVTTAPENLTSTLTAPTTVLLKWSPPRNNRGDAPRGYTVHQRVNGGPWAATALAGTRTDSPGTEITVNSLTVGSTYEFRVAAENRAGLSRWSATTLVSLPSSSRTVTFSSAGAVNQAFTVPDGVTVLHVSAAGAQGGYGGTPGTRVSTTLHVTPGQQLIVQVGQQGRGVGYQCVPPMSPQSEPGGWPGGGGNGWVNLTEGCKLSPGSGGGYSGVFFGVVSQATALVVAGGGGGARLEGWPGGVAGGDGEDASGTAAGAAGSPSASVGVGPTAGSPLRGGDGGWSSRTGIPGGGGGGGYFGGGGGGGGDETQGHGGGGGTGSSYSTGANSSVTVKAQGGNGVVTFTW